MESTPGRMDQLQNWFKKQAAFTHEVKEVQVQVKGKDGWSHLAPVAGGDGFRFSLVSKALIAAVIFGGVAGAAQYFNLQLPSQLANLSLPSKIFNLRLPTALVNFRIPTSIISSTLPIGLGGGALAALFVNFGVVPQFENTTPDMKKVGPALIHKDIEAAVVKKGLDKLKFELTVFEEGDLIPYWQSKLMDLLRNEYTALQDDYANLLPDDDTRSADSVKGAYIEMLKSFQAVAKALDSEEPKQRDVLLPLMSAIEIHKALANGISVSGEGKIVDLAEVKRGRIDVVSSSNWNDDGSEYLAWEAMENLITAAAEFSDLAS